MKGAFFSAIISPRAAQGCLGLIVIAGELKQAYAAKLAVFSFACEYWVQGNDEAALKDVPPDALRFVRRVIEMGEKKTGTGTST